MNWFQLISALLPVAEEVYKSVSDAIAAGKSADAIHANVVDHVAQLPAVIRAQ